MKTRIRLLSALMALVMLSLCGATLAEDIDLTGMTTLELRTLRDRIDAEIAENHTPSQAEKEEALAAVKAYVDAAFQEHGATVTWPWLDYTYTRDGSVIGVQTTIDFSQGGSSASAKLNAEVTFTDGDCAVTYLAIGDEVLLARAETRSMPAEPEVTAAPKPTKTPKPAPTATKKPSRTPRPKATATPRPKATATPRPTKTPRPTPTPVKRDGYGVGETAVYKNIRYTVTGWRESRGSSWNSPDSGNIYVLVSFQIENNSSEDLSLSTLLYFDGYCDDYSLDYSFGAAMEEKGSLDGTIARGKKVKGEYGVEVPKDWKTIEITITPGWFEDTLTFYIDK